MYKLILRDGVDTIRFVNDSEATFYLIDETFEMELPEVSEEYTDYVYSWAAAINSRSYGPREVSFAVKIKGSTRQAVLNAMDRLFRMASRALSDKHLGSGSMSTSYSYEYSSGASVVSGAQGLQLVIQVGDASSSSATGEFGQSYTTDNDTLFYVLSMDVTDTVPISSTGITFNGQEYAIYDVWIRLKCSAFGYGDPLNITLSPSPGASGYNGPPHPFVNNATGARVIVSGGSIPGSGEALTRITIKESGGSGVIIGRDTGRSLINCPSTFYNSSTLQRQASTHLIPVGYREGTQRRYDVQVMAQNPVSLRYRVDGGAWSSNVSPSAYQYVQVVAEEFGFFVTSTNFTTVAAVNDILTSISTSYYSHSTKSINVVANIAQLSTEAGYTIETHYFVVQPGIHGKYKILAPIALSGTGTDIEFSAQIGFSTREFVTVPAYTNWTRPTTGTYTFDFGEIDTTPRGMPHGVTPGAITIVSVSIVARAVVGNPTGYITSYGMYLVPCGDDRSYMRAQWSVDSSWAGFQVISNFDPRNPYIGMVTNDYRTGYSPSSIYSVAVGLDETHEGTPVTLVPGVTNTLLIIPTFSTTPDFRTGVPINALPNTGNTTLAIRPAYMVAR